MKYIYEQDIPLKKNSLKTISRNHFDIYVGEIKSVDGEKDLGLY